MADAAPAPTSSLPVVLFDLDGTLIDSLELLVSSMRHAFEIHAGPPPDEATWVSYIGRTLGWQFSQFAPEEAIPALVERYRAFQSQHLDRLTRPFDGMPDLVARLHAAGHPLGVVTSKIDTLAHRSLDVAALSRYMHVVIGADSCTRHKPDPEPVLLALERLGAAPDRGVYIGDSPFDIMAGNAAGVVTIGVTWGAATAELLRDAAATHVATSPAQLETLLAVLTRPATPPATA